MSKRNLGVFCTILMVFALLICNFNNADLIYAFPGTQVNVSKLSTEERNKFKSYKCTTHGGDTEVLYVVTSGVTCTTGGTATYSVYCKECAGPALGSWTTDVGAAGHKSGSATIENEKAASCKAPYTWDLVYYCTVCRAQISRQTLNDGKILAHTPGSEVVENEKAATCTESKHHDVVKYCTVCHEEIYGSRQTIYEGDPLGHTKGEFVRNQIKTNCDSLGDELGDMVQNRGTSGEIYMCTTCHNEYEYCEHTHSLPDNEDEDHVIRNTVDPTCTEDGYDEIILKCPECEATLEHLKSTEPMVGHTPAKAVKENDVEPTCTKDGSYEMVVYCSVCKAELSRDKTTIDKLGHGATTIINKKSATMDQEGYTGDTICTVCNEVLTYGSTIAKLSKESVNENNVSNLVDNNLSLNKETKEELKELTKDSKEEALKIVNAANNTIQELGKTLRNGKINVKEYGEAVKKIETIIEVTIKAENQKEEIENKAESLNNIIPQDLDIDLKEEIDELYNNQLAQLFSEDGSSFNLELSIETYQNVLDFINDSIEKIEESVLLIKECSRESFIESINQYIRNVSAKTFKDFDKEKADAEFVEAAYKAILINMQYQVIDSLNSNYEQAKASGKYYGTSLKELEENYNKEISDVLDLDYFELMVNEVMRLKYVSKLGEKLSKGEIDEADYLTLMNASTDVDSFMPIYKEIFKSWALNTNNDYGMSLEELTKATLDLTNKTMIPSEYRGGITTQDKAVIIGIIGVGGFGTTTYVLLNDLKKKKWSIKYE